MECKSRFIFLIFKIINEFIFIFHPIFAVSLWRGTNIDHSRAPEL